MKYVCGPASRLLLHLWCLVVSCHFSSSIVRGQQPVVQKTSPPPGATGAIGNAKLAEKPVDVVGGCPTVRIPQRAKVEAREEDAVPSPPVNALVVGKKQSPASPSNSSSMFDSSTGMS